MLCDILPGTKPDSVCCDQIRSRWSQIEGQHCIASEWPTLHEQVQLHTRKKRRKKKRSQLWNCIDILFLMRQSFAGWCGVCHLCYWFVVFRFLSLRENHKWHQWIFRVSEGKWDWLVCVGMNRCVCVCACAFCFVHAQHASVLSCLHTSVKWLHIFLWPTHKAESLTAQMERIAYTCMKNNVGWTKQLNNQLNVFTYKVKKSRSAKIIWLTEK